MSVVRANTRFTTNARAVITTKRTRTAQAAPPSNSSPHHLVLVSPVQMENDEPPLNEWRKTNPMGMNMNSRTRTAHAAMTSRLTSTEIDVRVVPAAARDTRRRCIERRIDSLRGASRPTSRGTTQTTTAPTTSANSTAPIINTAIAEPSGQFWACENCDAIIEPIMLPLAPPSTVAVT